MKIRKTLNSPNLKISYSVSFILTYSICILLQLNFMNIRTHLYFGYCLYYISYEVYLLYILNIQMKYSKLREIVFFIYQNTSILIFLLTHITSFLYHYIFIINESNKNIYFIISINTIFFTNRFMQV